MSKKFWAKAAVVFAGLGVVLATSMSAASADGYATKSDTVTAVSFAHYVEQYGTPNVATIHVTSDTQSAPSGSVTIVLSGKTFTQTWHKQLNSSGEASQGLPANLPVGTYAVSASYAGNAKYLPSNGQSHFSVMKARGDVVNVNARDIRVGQHGVVQGMVDGAGATPTGTVSITVKRGTSVVATATDKLSGTGHYYAVLKTFPHRGTLSVTVRYAGDSRYSADRASGSFTVSR